MKILSRSGALIVIAGMALTQNSCVAPQAISAVAHTGSGTFEQIAKRRQLERVARDWCMTIRASQIIPVYPLDEDINPGDIYIATTPVQTAQNLWRKHGFLPIDHRFARLRPEGYADYYRGGYHTAGGVVLPNNWQFPAVPPQGGDGGSNSVFEKTDWQSAPRAGFPSYGFSIKRGESFSGALPVQGVPVALGALGARSVTGTITITNAFTYGVDEVSLRSQWEKWASRQAIKDKLRAYAPINDTDKPRCYLRVITRVYLARTMNVSMTNQDSSAWKLSAGAPRDDIKNFGLTNIARDANGNLTSTPDTELDTLAGKLPGQSPNTGATTENATAGGADPAASADAATKTPEEIALDKQTKKRGLERALMKDRFGGFVVPGGTLQMTSATQNTVSMNETFDRPLVIGYHAVDVPIFSEGEIGTPISTYLALEGRNRYANWLQPRHQTVVEKFEERSMIEKKVLSWIERSPKANSQRLITWIQSNHPELKDLALEQLIDGDHSAVLQEFANQVPIR